MTLHQTNIVQWTEDWVACCYKMIGHLSTQKSNQCYSIPWSGEFRWIVISINSSNDKELGQRMWHINLVSASSALKETLIAFLDGWSRDEGMIFIVSGIRNVTLSISLSLENTIYEVLTRILIQWILNYIKDGWVYVFSSGSRLTVSPSPTPRTLRLMGTPEMLPLATAAFCSRKYLRLWDQ